MGGRRRDSNRCAIIFLGRLWGGIEEYSMDGRERGLCELKRKWG